MNRIVTLIYGIGGIGIGAALLLTSSTPLVIGLGAAALLSGFFILSRIPGR